MGDDQNEPSIYFKIIEESTLKEVENYFNENGWHQKHGEYKLNMNLKDSIANKL